MCEEIGLNMIRAGTAGVHRRFIAMIRELVQERLDANAPRLCLGHLPPGHDVCPVDCCPSGRPAR